MFFYQLGKYYFTFPKTYQYEVDNNEQYISLDFICKTTEDKYSIVNNKTLGYRLITDKHPKYGHGKMLHEDVPFKEETFHKLPNDIKVSIVKE